MPQDNYPLIDQIREEANSNKECFTKFSFQAIAIGAAGLGVIVKFSNSPQIEYVGILVILLTLLVSRIGNHKYATANRNFGYELHLSRVKTLIGKSNSQILNKVYEIEWEAAMLSWRIVHSFIYARIYDVSHLKGHYTRKEAKNIEYKWWDTKSLTKNWEESKTNKDDIPKYYHAGEYLKNMQNTLYFVAFLSLIPLGVHAYKQLHISITQNNTNNQLAYACFATAAVVGLSSFIIWRIQKDRRRRIILERELASIQSASLAWRAVTIAYHLAEHKSLEDHGSYENLTKNLCTVAEVVTKRLGTLHQWMDEICKGDDPNAFWKDLE